MKTIQRVAVFVGFCLACSMIIRLVLACILGFPTPARAQDADNRGSHDVRQAHDTPESRKEVDLGDGIRLTEVVFESDSGEVKMCASTLARNGKRLMTTVWNKTAKNRAGETFTRAYWHNGKVLLSEANEGDTCELLVLHDEAGGPLRAFEEKKDGRLVPVSDKRLGEMRREYRFMIGIMTPIVEGAKKGVSEDQKERLIKDAINKAKRGMDNQAQSPPHKR